MIRKQSEKALKGIQSKHYNRKSFLVQDHKYDQDNSFKTIDEIWEETPVRY